MAKSIRSKWKRKMRKVKRERYAKKDLETLKRVTQLTVDQEEEMKELYNVKTADEIVKNKKKGDDSDSEGMDIDKRASKFHPRTMKNEHGNYPPWMNQRAIQQQKNKQKAKKKGKKKQVGKKK